MRCLFNLLTSELINMEETHSAENRAEFVERFGTESKGVVLRYLEDERVKMSYSNHEASSTLTTMDETAASCLMLLSKVGEWTPDRAFECKTCGRKFSSFQALGGHRASHKKPKLDQDQSTPSVTPGKPRSHKCSICGAQFALGQALGGHMRRHRDSASVKSACSGGERDETATFLIKSSIEKVCLGLELDLNLTPRENDLQKGLLVESDLKLQLGKRDYEMELGSLQEYDLRMQIGKRRRFEDTVVGLVV